MTPEETARHWRHPGVVGVDLLRARYVRHAFARHVHDTYTIGLVRAGVEEWRHDGGVERAGPGGMPIVNPGTVHTGYAGVPEGWTYRVLYPSVALMTDIAAELGLPRGTPWFRAAVLDRPDLAHALLVAHRAAEGSDALAASSLVRLLLGRLLTEQAAFAPGGRPRIGDAGSGLAGRARDVLESRLADPPGLDSLAAALGTGPFALIRAFRRTYGLPPHAYLTQRRIDRARILLAAGQRPAVVASTVGFADQAHLNRHFRRIVGVPPGAYRAERRNVQDRPVDAALPWPGEFT